MCLSKEITIVREKGFCTQNDFARRIGVSYSTVNRWESGKMNPNVSTMKKIKVYCDEMGINFENIELAWLDETLKNRSKDSESIE